MRSEAQKRKLEQLVKDGKMSKETFDSMNSKVKGKLPERSSSKVKLTKLTKVIK